MPDGTTPTNQAANDSRLVQLIDSVINLLNRAEVGDALDLLAGMRVLAAEAPPPVWEDIEARIQTQRLYVLKATSFVSVVMVALNPQDQYDLLEVLDEAHTLLDRAAGRMDSITSDVKAAAAKPTQDDPHTVRMLDVWSHLDEFKRGKVFGFAVGMATEQDAPTVASIEATRGEPNPSPGDVTTLEQGRRECIPFEQREQIDKMHDKLIAVSGVLGTIYKAMDEASEIDMEIHDAQLSVRLVRTQVDSVMCELGDMLGVKI